MAKKKKMTTRTHRIYFFNRLGEDGTLNRMWEKFRNAAEVAAFFDAFRADHIDERLWLQMGVEDPEAYDSEWNRFWWSGVVGAFVKRFDDYDRDYADEVLQIFSPQFFSSEARKNLEMTFGFAKKEYISECLKVFFEDMYDENTGLPVTKSFSKTGNIGKDQIRKTLPYIQRWASIHLELYIPDYGENYDVRHSKDLKDSKKKEQKLWNKTGKA